jgi:hypothetical protein
MRGALLLETHPALQGAAAGQRSGLQHQRSGLQQPALLVGVAGSEAASDGAGAGAGAGVASLTGAAARAAAFSLLHSTRPAPPPQALRVTT